MSNFISTEVNEVALSMMEGLDSPRSLTVAILLRYREWQQLFELSVDPKHHIDSDSYVRAAFATEFLSKLDANLLPDLDLEQKAVEKWLWSEVECFKTNRRLDPFVYRGSTGFTGDEGALFTFMEKARKAVEWMIGPRPPSTFEGAFGPGATISDSSGYTTVCHKMSSRITLTTNALFHLIPWMGSKWGLAHASQFVSEPEFVRGNIFFTVPKKATSKRGCAKGASLNSFYQLGLGRVLRQKLKARGIDLDDGQDIHRQVACSASKTGSHATIDLTSASDTIATALVELLLPHDWHVALCDLREPFTQVNGKWHRLEKFSSMGNGFTFELETLIYASLAIAVSDFQLTPGKDLFVYGDDIIIPSEYSEAMIAALKYFGFTPNPSKTFLEGSFRESCGGDFFDGEPVRAHYLKEVPNEPHQFISLANGIRRMANQNRHNPSLWPRLRRAWFKCLDFIPSTIRCLRGPEGLGDIVIHDVEEKWNCRWRASARIERPPHGVVSGLPSIPRDTRKSVRFIKCYRPATFKGVGFERFGAPVQFAAALYRIALVNTPGRAENWKLPEGRDSRRLILRDGVLGYKVGWAVFS